MAVLVLGQGLLGSEIVKQTGWQFISRQKNNFDFTKLGTYSTLLKGYDTIVNCIAYTNTYSEDINRHWETNFKAVIDLAEHCNVTNKKLIHISSDFVYANSEPFCSEEQLAVPQATAYAQSKLAADMYLKYKANSYLVLRATHKPTPFPYACAWNNQAGNFDYVDRIASLMIQLINKQAQGIYNVGTATKTMYELAKETRPDVHTASITTSLTPQDTTMNLARMKSFLSL